MSEHELKPLNFIEYKVDEMLEKSRAFYENIKRRRSVRMFSDRAIPVETLRNAVLSAGSAPSGANMQPWHFAVVSDPDIKRKIREAAEEEERTFYERRASEEWLGAINPLGVNADKPFLETAPSLIVIFLKKYTVDEKGEKRRHYYTSESVGIATGILITALHMSGLGTLTYTPNPMKFLNKILGRPDSERPFMVLVVGYPSDEAVAPAIEKHPLEKISTFY